MSQPKAILAIFIALFVGAMSSHLTALLVPSAAAAPAAAPAALSRWEYACKRRGLGNPFDDNLSDMRRVANEFGLQGWELVGISTEGHILVSCFKRPYVDRPVSATPAMPPASAPLPKGVAPRTDSDD